MKSAKALIEEKVNNLDETPLSSGARNQLRTLMERHGIQAVFISCADILRERADTWNLEDRVKLAFRETAHVIEKAAAKIQRLV